MADRLETVLATLERAAVQTATSNWAAHDRLVQDLVESVQLVYLRTDFFTGELASRLIQPDPAGQRVPLGAIPVFVEPLVAMLERMTEDMGTVPKSEEPAWDRWRDRLNVYRETVDASGVNMAPSESVWSRVTMPLCAGVYPLDFDQFGIVNPEVRSPPDVVYPATVAFQIALNKQLQKERWAALWGDLRTNAANMLTGTAKAAGFGVGIIVAAGLIGGALLLRRSTRESEAQS